MAMVTSRNESSSVASVAAELSGSAGIATFPAAAAPANGISLAEVLRDLWDAVRNGTGGLEPGTNKSLLNELQGAAVNYNRNGSAAAGGSGYVAVTADLSSATWNTAATHEVFTVTGLVRMRVVIEVTITGDDTSGNTAKFAFGTQTTGNLFSGSTPVDIDDMTAGDIVTFQATNTAVPASTTALGMLDAVVNGDDVGYTISGEAATAGTVVFHCWWEALNATGLVAAGLGGAL